MDSVQAEIPRAAIFENHFRGRDYQGTMIPAIHYATCVASND